MIRVRRKWSDVTLAVRGDGQLKMGFSMEKTEDWLKAKIRCSIKLYSFLNKPL